MWQFGRNIFLLQCGYFRTALMYQNTGEWVESPNGVWLQEGELMKGNTRWRGDKEIFIIKLIQLLLTLCVRAEYTIMTTRNMAVRIIFPLWVRLWNMLLCNRLLTPTVIICGTCALPLQRYPVLSTCPHVMNQTSGLSLCIWPHNTHFSEV